MNLITFDRMRVEVGVQEMLDVQRERPLAQDVARLIGCGLTEAIVIDTAERLGMPSPDMHTLDDLPAVLPVMQQANDLLLHSDDADRYYKTLYAARDVELQGDDAAIVAPHANTAVMPSSNNLWEYVEGDMGRAFLGSYGLSQTEIADPNNDYLIVDSGFRGSVLLWLDSAISRVHGVSLRQQGRLSGKLMCVDSARPLAEQIIADEAYNGPEDVSNFSYAHRLLGKNLTDHGTPLSRVAVAMQFMPKRHESYDDLVVVDGVVQAVSTGTKYIETKFNRSVVDPVAATVAQVRVVEAAMTRSGNYF